MNWRTHRFITLKAVDILNSEIGTTLISVHKPLIAHVSCKVDYVTDLEYVNVEVGKDDPHSSEFFEFSDVAHCSERGDSLTAMNHFIDIKKGRGRFDDYDGYSYYNGSGSKNEVQSSRDKAEGFLEELVADITDFKVDEGVMWWFNDEYVHCPAHEWYKNCSPCLEKYSFFRDKGTYADATSELGARFPRAICVGSSDCGVPYSVFMPIDNMARYWYGRFMDNLELRALGFVMHAIQDAGIPHHAAGCLGNWHGEYEGFLRDACLKAGDTHFDEAAFDADVKSLYEQWDSNDDPNPPRSPTLSDVDRVPSKSWRIDQLVTWLALNAYKSYAEVYKEFNPQLVGEEIEVPNPRFGQNTNSFEIVPPTIKVRVINDEKLFKQNLADVRNLAVLSTAMSVLVLKKALEERNLTFAGNKRTMKIHRFDCRFSEIDSSIRAEFQTTEAAVQAGFARGLCCLKPCPDLKEEGSYVYNKNSGEMHMADCYCVPLIQPQNRRTCTTLDEVFMDEARNGFLQGYYQGCRHCLPMYDNEGNDINTPRLMLRAKALFAYTRPE